MTGPGSFISFEGGDGAGKSTQIKLLAEHLRNAGHSVVITREPGGTDGAEAIRSLIVKGATDRWSPLSESLLMYAARADHLEKVILPAVARGEVVISDRFSDSTMAYQGLAGSLGREPIEKLHNLVVGDHGPNLTIILDAPAEEGLRRATADDGETRFEDKGTAFQQSVRDAFLTIAQNAPERCVVIDARDPIDVVAKKVLGAVEQRLPHLFKK